MQLPVQYSPLCFSAPSPCHPTDAVRWQNPAVCLQGCPEAPASLRTWCWDRKLLGQLEVWRGTGTALVVVSWSHPTAWLGVLGWHEELEDFPCSCMLDMTLSCISRVRSAFVGIYMLLKRWHLDFLKGEKDRNWLGWLKFVCVLTDSQPRPPTAPRSTLWAAAPSLLGNHVLFPSEMKQIFPNAWEKTCSCGVLRQPFLCLRESLAQPKTCAKFCLIEGSFKRERVRILHCVISWLFYSISVGTVK